MDFQSAMETFAEAWVAANTKTNLNEIAIQNEALALTRTTSPAEQTSTTTETSTQQTSPTKVEHVQQQSPPMSTLQTNEQDNTPEQQQQQQQQQTQQYKQQQSSRIRSTITDNTVLPNTLTVTLRTNSNNNKTHELNNNTSENCDGDCKTKQTGEGGASGAGAAPGASGGGDDIDDGDQQTITSTSPLPALPTSSSSSSSSSSTSICKVNNKTAKNYENDEEDLDHDLRINASNNNCYDLSKNACGKSIPVHCVVETIYSIDDANYSFNTNTNNWRRPIVEVDSYVIIPVTTYFHELVQVALNRLGYSPDSSSAAKGSIVIKNWKALTFDKIADNPLVTVGDILGELTTIATLKIQVYRSRPTYASDIKDKLLRFFLIQSRNMLLSTGCPLDELTLTQLCRGANNTSVGITNTNTNCKNNNGGGNNNNGNNGGETMENNTINNNNNKNDKLSNNQYELSDDDRRKFDQWWTSQLSPTTIQRAVVAAAVAHAQQQQQQSITNKTQHNSTNNSVTAAAIVNAALSQQYSSTSDAHSFNDTENNLLYSNLASYNARILLECQSNQQQSTQTTTSTITTTATTTTTSTATSTTNNVAAAVINAAVAAGIEHSGHHHPTHIHPALQTVQNQYPNQKTRMRTSFDPELELPKLQSWFSENQHPSRQQIQHYVKELNNLESRRGRKPLDINNVVYWFKNARAAQKRAENRTIPAVTNHLSMVNGYNNHNSTIENDHHTIRSSSASLAPSLSPSGGVSIKSSLMHALNAAADNYIHHQRRHDDIHPQMMLFKHSNPANDLNQVHNLSMSEELSNGESDDVIDDDVIENTDHENDHCPILSPIGPLSLTTNKKHHFDNSESDRECRTPRSPVLVSPTIINEHIKNVIKSEMNYQKTSPLNKNDNTKRNNLTSDNMDTSDNDDPIDYDNDADNDVNDDNNNSDNVNNSDNLNVNNKDNINNIDNIDNNITEQKIKQERNILDNDTFYKLDLSSRTTKSSLLRNYQHHYHQQRNSATPPLSATDNLTGDDRTTLDRLATNFPLVPNSMFSHSIMYMSHYIPGLAQHGLHHHPHHGGAHVQHPTHAHTPHHQHQPTSVAHNLSTNPMNGIGNSSLSPNINTLQALTAAAAAAAAAAASSSSSSVSVSVSDERRKRNRTFIDPVTEVPRLEQWFSLSTHPSHNLILKYTEELNRMPYRQKFPRLEPKNVQFWFKNRRAKCKRLKIALYDTNVHSQYNNSQCKQD